VQIPSQGTSPSGSPTDVGVDVIAKSATGAVVIGNQQYHVTGGKVETIAGPDALLMLVRTNSVSGKTSILHSAGPGEANGNMPGPAEERH
jgi:hypothetical protein